MTPPTTPSALDFAAIRSSCPKAFAALCEWVATNGPGYLADERVELWASVNWRRLYDFFDRKGVYVTVDKCYATWKWTIWNESGYPLSWSDGLAGYPPRTAAESAAFMAAFGKLEEMLKQEKSNQDL